MRACGDVQRWVGVTIREFSDFGGWSEFLSFSIYLLPRWCIETLSALFCWALKIVL